MSIKLTAKNDSLKIGGSGGSVKNAVKYVDTLPDTFTVGEVVALTKAVEGKTIDYKIYGAADGIYTDNFNNVDTSLMATVDKVDIKIPTEPDISNYDLNVYYNTAIYIGNEAGINGDKSNGIFIAFLNMPGITAAVYGEYLYIYDNDKWSWYKGNIISGSFEDIEPVSIAEVANYSITIENAYIFDFFLLMTGGMEMPEVITSPEVVRELLNQAIIEATKIDSGFYIADESGWVAFVTGGYTNGGDIAELAIKKADENIAALEELKLNHNTDIAGIAALINSTRENLQEQINVLSVNMPKSAEEVEY